MSCCFWEEDRIPRIPVQSIRIIRVDDDLAEWRMIWRNVRR